MGADGYDWDDWEVAEVGVDGVSLCSEAVDAVDEMCDDTFSFLARGVRAGDAWRLVRAVGLLTRPARDVCGSVGSCLVSSSRDSSLSVDE